MVVRIRFAWDEDLKMNKVVGYTVVTDSMNPPAINQDEVLIEKSHLPSNFFMDYFLCIVDNGKVKWSDLLYNEYRHRKVPTAE